MGVYNTIDTNDTIGVATILLIVILTILAIALYVGQAIFLNMLNQKVRDKKTWQAWVPIVNLYLLGELTFNSNIAGYALVAISIICSLMDHSVIGSFIVIGVYIYAIAKYVTTLKEEHDELSPKMNISTTTEKEKNPFKIKKPKLSRFEKKEETKKTEEQKEEPQQYQSQQPMNANSFKENNNGFDNRGGLGSSSNSSSLQDLYRK